MPQAVLSSLGPQGLFIPPGPWGCGVWERCREDTGAGRGDLERHRSPTLCTLPFPVHPRPTQLPPCLSKWDGLRTGCQRPLGVGQGKRREGEVTGRETLPAPGQLQSGEQGGGGSRSTERSICPRALRSLRPGLPLTAQQLHAQGDTVVPGHGLDAHEASLERHLKYVLLVGIIVHVTRENLEEEEVSGGPQSQSSSPSDPQI